jgi:hypothetical protein
MERPWPSLDEIPLDVEVSRIPGKYPLVMTATLVGYKYREVEPFVEALVARCRRRGESRQGRKARAKFPPNVRLR